MKLGSEKRLLNRLTYVCLLFPHARKEGKGRHAIFLFEGKAFAYFLSNHRENGLNGVCCKASPDQIESYLVAQPEKWYLPAYLGSKGWLGLRLDENSDWNEVYNFVRYSYLCTAPHLVEGLKYPPVLFG
jgi:predicted DNA-binding protein (MmcQ/YjbR family)